MSTSDLRNYQLFFQVPFTHLLTPTTSFLVKVSLKKFPAALLQSMNRTSSPVYVDVLIDTTGAPKTTEFITDSTKMFDEVPAGRPHGVESVGGKGPQMEEI